MIETSGQTELTSKAPQRKDTRVHAPDISSQSIEHDALGASSEDDLLPPVPRSAWSRLAACTAAAALLQLDGTLITVALPSVARGLSVQGSSTSVVLSAYFAA